MAKWIVLIVATSTLSISGCGVHSSLPDSLATGMVLGWHNHTYKIMKSVSPTVAGKKLGTAMYYGRRLSGTFTAFQLKGTNTSKAIVFESYSKKYYQANMEKKNAK